MWKYLNEGRFLGDIKFYIVVCLLFLGITIWKGCKEKSKIDSLPNIEYKKPEKTYVDEKGKTHSEITSTPVSTKILESLVDSLISENKRLKNTVSLVQVTTKIDTVFKERIVWKDSTKGEFEISKKDQWIDMVAKGNTKSGEGEIKIRITDTISVVTRTKKHLFKPNETIIDFSTANPYNRTQTMRSFIVPQSRNVITFGPMVGIGYSDKIRPFIGVGAVFNVISIKTRR